jgi:hypothetical protein
MIRNLYLIILILLIFNFNLFPIDDNTIYYISKINNLNLRESPGIKGKIIRLIKEKEKLEFIEKGQDDTINGIKGVWIKIKTEKNEMGWCFDAYLELYKNKGIKKLKTDLEIMGYKGKIKEITIKYTYNDKTIDRYDINGNLVDGESYNGNNEIKERYIYKRDENGNKYVYNEKGELQNKTIYIYNEKGNIIEYDSYDNNNLFESKTMDKFDNKDRKIESKTYRYERQKEPIFIDKSIFKYDKNGLLIERLEYRSEYSEENFVFGDRYKYEYNEKKILIKRQDIFRDGKILEEVYYKYDDKGNEIEATYYSLNAEKGKLEFGNKEETKYVYWE